MKLFLQGVIDGFQDFGFIINSGVVNILLTGIYVVGIGLTSIFAKKRCKKTLQCERILQKSYYKECEGSKDHYFYQF